MRKIILLAFVISTFATQAQTVKIDTALIGNIRREAFNNSKASEVLINLCDNIGPRLMWSPEYQKAADWISKKFNEWGISDVKYDSIGLMGKSWSINAYSAALTSPSFMSLIAYPKNWSPATAGTIESEVVWVDAKTVEDLDKYKGKLKGKIVLFSEGAMLRPETEAFVKVLQDTTLQRMASEKLDTAISNKEKRETEEYFAYLVEMFKLETKKVAFCKNEGVALILDYNYKYYGTVQVWAAVALGDFDNIYDYLALNASNPNFPETVPQMTISLEQYNYLIRLIKKQKQPKVKAQIDVKNDKAVEGFSVIAEIPGTDLKNEIVMIGGHLDSYPVGLSATDNTAGVVTCMETARIIKTLGLKPRRTIRIALWAAEEEGLLGSKAYIKKHFAKNSNETCYLYLNMDNGAGKFRGIYAQENIKAANIFKEWVKNINDPLFQTVCIRSTENTDHVAFDEAGLPGFQFIQDDLDYFKTYHTNMDMPERIPKDNLKHNSFIMASLAYMASVRDGDFPIK